MSENPTIDVVLSNVASPALAPPAAAASAVGAPLMAASLQAHSVAQLEKDLASLLVAARRYSPDQIDALPCGNDGTPRIASMMAVWLISQIGKVLGKPKLVNLSKVKREELRSLGGVAALLHRTLHQPATTTASAVSP